MSARAHDGPGIPAEPLPDRFLAHVRDRGLVRAGDHVLVALSGGLDSMVLLHLLRFSPLASTVRLTAAHFDHAMRPASAADAAWVRGVCRAWGVPLHEQRADTPLRGEAAARQARYGFLQHVATGCGADAVLTAHQRDDQAETVLFRLARGTGLRGLGGIPERRGRIVRPLLPFGRAELEGYARRARLRWREDESNRSGRYSRNRIRARLLPALEAARPGAAARLAELASAAAALERLWDADARALAREAVLGEGPGRIEVARSALLEYDPRTRARVMRCLLRRLGSTPGRPGTRLAVEFISSGESGTGIQPAAGVRLEREFDRLVLRRPGDSGTGILDRPIHIPTPGAGTAEALVGGARLTVRWGPEPPGAGGSSARFDPAAVRFPLVFRGWRPGDRITLAYGTKKLKKLLRERRIGRSARVGVGVLAEAGAGGRVLWVVGVARSALVPACGSRAWQVTVEHGEPS